jgi:hypothetical protein
MHAAPTKPLVVHRRSYEHGRRGWWRTYRGCIVEGVGKFLGRNGTDTIA